MPDPALRDLNGFLRELRWGFESVTPEERARIDRGTVRTVWRDGAAPRCETAGAGDGRADDQELLQESFEAPSRLRFGTASFGEEVSGRGGAFLRWFRDHSFELPRSWTTAVGETGASPFVPPWLIDDANTATTGDRELRRLIDAVVPLARRSVLDRGLTLESPEGRSALAMELQERIHRPRTEGGLGLRYDYVADRSHWRPDAVQAFARGSGDCNALSFIHFAMAERAGLNPSFIRISGRRAADGTMEEIFHVGTAIVAEGVDSLGRASDPAHPDVLTPFDPSARHTIGADWQWFPVTELEMAALHLRNVALRNAPTGAETSAVLGEQERLFGLAVGLTPNFEVMLDSAWFYRNRRHNEERADALTASARILNPTLHSTW